MGALTSTFGMLGTFAFGQALAGLRDLGRTPSAFSALAGLGAAMPTNKQERQLAKAMQDALNANAGRLRRIVARYGKEFGAGEQADLVQEAQVNILMKARNDPAFAADPEAWIAKVVTPAYMTRAIENAWISYMRSPRAKLFESGDVLTADAEGVEGESAVERAAADPAAAGGHEFTERAIRANREVPALLKLLVRNLDPVRKSQVKDIVILGMQAQGEAETLISKGYSSAEAKRTAYGSAAYNWSRKHTEAAPGYAIESGGEATFDAARFERDYGMVLARLKRIASGGGRPITTNQGVFISEGRKRGPAAGRDLEIPGSRIPVDESGRRRYVLAPSPFADDRAGRGKAPGKGTKKAMESAAAKEARLARKQANAAAKEQRKADRAAARADRLAKKAEKIAQARVNRTAVLDIAAAKLDKKRKELFDIAHTLTLEELTRRRAVIDDMAQKLAAKRAALASEKIKLRRAGERESQAVPSAPSFADSLMAVKALDREDDAIDKVEKAYAVQDAKVAAGLKGVSAFGGLLKKSKRKARKSAKRKSRR